ncbi:MAG TPA: hypothetical protein VLK58_26400 [Conexibacter sp.]|nr:hypothetical protein [Conexibacter sp.]
MAIYTKGTPVSVIEDGVETTLTVEMLAGEVLARAGGVAAVTGPKGDPGAPGAAGAGVPAGGAPGQLLAKSGSGDYATGWVAPPVGAATVGFVQHGASTTEPRPSGYGLVVWVGSGRPQHGQTGDIWIAS